MTILSVEEGRQRLGELRQKRQDAREGLDALDAERRSLLRTMLDQGVSQAELARWEGVTDWAITQAVRKLEPSTIPPSATRTLRG